MKKYTCWFRDVETQDKVIVLEVSLQGDTVYMTSDDVDKLFNSCGCSLEKSKEMLTIVTDISTFIKEIQEKCEQEEQSDVISVNRLGDKIHEFMSNLYSRFDILNYEEVIE